MAWIKKQKVACIALVDEYGFPNIKAMYAPRKIEGNCFYFTTNTSSMRAKHYQHNEKASIYFYHNGLRSTGVMLTGTMEVILDEDLKKELWSKKEAHLL